MCLRVENAQCYERALPVFATDRTVQHSPQGASRNPSLKNRVTRKLNKNSPNSWKCGPNCSQNIQLKLKHPHPTSFNC